MLCPSGATTRRARERKTSALCASPHSMRATCYGSFPATTPSTKTASIAGCCLMRPRRGVLPSFPPVRSASRSWLYRPARLIRQPAQLNRSPRIWHLAPLRYRLWLRPLLSQTRTPLRFTESAVRTTPSDEKIGKPDNWGYDSFLHTLRDLGSVVVANRGVG